MIEWENGEITAEPLRAISADDPVTCADYARRNNLLDTEGWRHLKRYGKNAKKLTRLLNQAKLRSYRETKKYKYGFEVPKDWARAMELDKLNGNNKWAEAVKYELGCINSYNVFENVGQNAPKITEGWKQIKVHFVFDVKHDGRFRGRLVADGHLTNVPVESVYSGVVSLRGIRLLTFLSELNKIPMWATDISSAYLEAYTKEKIFIKAGPEFGEIAGDFLIIRRALYGLRTSGARWHEKFATCLAAEGFSPCKAEPDIWMRDAGDCYEYVAVYVDDLAYCVKDPSGFVKMLETKHKFKLKGTPWQASQTPYDVILPPCR